MIEPKPLSRSAVPAALEKALRYRMLDEPAEAESICRDVLAIVPDHREAQVMLVLALTDQLDGRQGRAFEEARRILATFPDGYERAYYQGILLERQAKAALRAGGMNAGHFVHTWMLRAMDCFERAVTLRPPGNDDAVLRWNTCARILNDHPEVGPVEHDRPPAMLE